MEKKLTQQERFKLVAEEAVSDGREYVKDFIDAFLAIDNVDESLLDYFYRSDFLSYMQPENLDFCLKLLNERASRDWFMLIHTVYEEDEKDSDTKKNIHKDRDPGNFCKEFEVYYGLGIDIALLSEIYSDCSSVSDLREKMKPYIFVTGDKVISEGGRGKKKTSMNYEEQNGEIAVLRKQLSEMEGENKALHALLDETNERHRDEMLSANVEKQSLNEEIWTLRMEIQHIKDTGAEQNSMELKRLQMEVLQAEERIDVLEEMKRSLIEDNEQLEGSLRSEKDRSNTLEEELAGTSKDLVTARNYVVALEEQNEKLQKELEDEKSKPKGDAFGIGETGAGAEPEYEEAGIEEDRGEPEEATDRIGGVIRITDATSQIRKKSNVFARIFSKFQERLFEQKSESDQKNLLFMKMMNMDFSQDKMKLVKNSINAAGSYLELYKMVNRNASDEEFDEYYRSLGPAA